MSKYLCKSFMFIMVIGLLVATIESAEARRGPVPPGKVDSYNGNSRVEQPGSAAWKPQFAPSSEMSRFAKSQPYPVYDGYLRATKPAYKPLPDYSARGVEVTPQRNTNAWRGQQDQTSNQQWKKIDASWSNEMNYAYPSTPQKEINGLKPDKHFTPSGKLATSGRVKRESLQDNSPGAYIADVANTAEKILAVPFAS